MPCPENLVKQWENDEDNYRYFGKGDFYLSTQDMHVCRHWLVDYTTHY